MRFAAAIFALLTSVSAVAQTTTMQSFIAMPWSLGISLLQWINQDDKKTLYIEVTAEGADLEQARQSAFRMAVERSVGTVIASETEMRDSRIKRDEIISYASGYVTDYRLVDQLQRGNRTWVKMQVWVRHSAIADRLLARSENTQSIDGKKLSDQVQSLNYERDQGARLLTTVMNDYPHRAFIIENQSTETRYGNRQPEIVIEFDLRFNRIYLYSLWETLKNTAQTATSGNCYPNCQAPYVVYVQGRNDNLLFNRWAWSFGFTESTQPGVMQAAMFDSQPGVLLTIRDASGNGIYQECFFWAELDGVVRSNYPQKPMVWFSNDRTMIDGNAIHRGRIEVRNPPGFVEAQNIKLEVVRKSKCPG